MADVHPVLVKYGKGAAVGADLRCPRWEHRDLPTIPGSAEVLNDYGVVDVRPRRCKVRMWTGRPCDCLLEVVRIVDVEAATPEPDEGRTK